MSQHPLLLWTPLWHSAIFLCHSWRLVQYCADFCSTQNVESCWDLRGRSQRCLWPLTCLSSEPQQPCGSIIAQRPKHQAFFMICCRVVTSLVMYLIWQLIFVCYCIIHNVFVLCPTILSTCSWFLVYIWVELLFFWRSSQEAEAILQNHGMWSWNIHGVRHRLRHASKWWSPHIQTVWIPPAITFPSPGLLCWRWPALCCLTCWTVCRLTSGSLPPPGVSVSWQQLKAQHPGMPVVP